MCQDQLAAEVKLPLGGCRILVDAIDENQIDKNGNQKTKFIFPPQGPVFIVSRQNRAIYVCHVRQVGAGRSNMPMRIGFQDGIQLVGWNPSQKVQPNEGLAACIDLVNKITKCKIQIEGQSLGKAICSHPPTKKYPHVTIHPDNPERTDIQSSFCAFSMETAIPLVSIMLCDTTNSKAKRAPSMLSFARRKRHLAGIYVVFGNREVTTEIKLEDEEEEGNRYSVYKVESVTASVASTKGLLYLILPSTMITLLPSEETEEEKRQEPRIRAGRRQPPREAKMASQTTQCLIRTVRCLRGSAKASVSKSCLLSGPPGVGKTYSVKHAYDVCQEEGPTLLLSLGSLMGSVDSSRQASRLLSRRFEEAAEACRKDNQFIAILFIDECDALLSSDEVAGMLASLLDRAAQDHEGWERIIFVAATNHADKLPFYLRRPGRFDKEISVPPPRAHERLGILELLIDAIANISPLGPQSLRDLAGECVGYVAADLVSLVRRVVALVSQGTSDSINLDLFRKAMLDVRASALRDYSFVAPKKIKWSDVAGDPGRAQTILQQTIEWPRTKPEAFKSLGLRPPKGILLYGPPGCAKTTLVRAAAGAAGSAFIAFSPSDVYASSYLGEAERIVRNAFKLARSTNPCILFFDEIDAIIGSDGDGHEPGMGRSGGGSSAESRVLSTFLNEMDGVDGSWEDGMIVLAASNRPWTLDKALLRSGRLDKLIYVPPPDVSGRLSIIEVFCKDNRLRKEHIEHLASSEVSGLMTVAEIVGACRVAWTNAFKEATRHVCGEHETEYIEVTLDRLKASLSATQPLLSEPGYLDPFLDFERSRLRF